MCKKWHRHLAGCRRTSLNCAMNTWEVNLGTCTVVEEKQNANPSPSRHGTAAAASAFESAREYRLQSQIPMSSLKLIYHSFIFGSGQRQMPRTSLRSSERSSDTVQHESPGCSPLIPLYIASREA